MRWYLFDMSTGVPVLQQEGDVVANVPNIGRVAGLPDLYGYASSIDINAAGTIGLTYMQSGSGAGQFMSMFVTGRTVNDAPGSMQTPVPVAPGVQNYAEAGAPPFRAGDISGINVDIDGTFWAGNEFATPAAAPNWGTGIGHFTLATPLLTAPTSAATADQFPYGIAVGDFDGDGKNDMAVTNYLSDTVSIRFGNGDGTFVNPVTTVPLPARTRPFGITTGKLNRTSPRDGIVVAGFGNPAEDTLPVDVRLSGVTVIRFPTDRTPTVNTISNRTGQGTNAESHELLSVAVGDLNSDDKLDIVGTGYDGTLTVLLGNGDGTFPGAPSFIGAAYKDASLYSVAIANYATGPGGAMRADFVLAAYSAGAVVIVAGNNDGSWGAPVSTTVVGGANNGFLAVADLNKNGVPDVATTRTDIGGVAVMLGNANGTLGPVTTYATGNTPRSVIAPDLNGDGNPDLALANQVSNSVSLFLGNGNGSFQAAQTFAFGQAPFALSAGDFDNDTAPDMVAPNAVGNPHDAVFLGRYNAPTSVPRISGFSVNGVAQSHAQVGTQIVINGVGFLNVLLVRFRNNAGGDIDVTPLPGFTNTQITVTVPNGAVTGYIRVIAAGGIGVSLDLFTVDP